MAETPAPAGPPPLTPRPQVPIGTVGHGDPGKSTLAGRLLHETGSLPEGKLEMLKAVSARRGMPFEWSFLLDALQTERGQGITIATPHIASPTGSRAPGLPRRGAGPPLPPRFKDAYGPRRDAPRGGGICPAHPRCCAVNGGSSWRRRGANGPKVRSRHFDRSLWSR